MKRFGLLLLAVWLAGGAALMLVVAPGPEPEDAAVAVLREARSSGDATAYRAAFLALQQISPPHTALERLRAYVGKRTIPGMPEGDWTSDYAMALTNPETRDPARLLRATMLLRGTPREQRIGVDALRSLALAGNSSAVVTLADHLLATGDPDAVELARLYRSAAIRNSIGAERMARLLEENPGLAVSPFEARDMRALASRLLDREAAKGQVGAMLALANRLAAPGASPQAMARAQALYTRAMRGGSLEAMVKLAVLMRDPGNPAYDRERSRSLLETAVERGSVAAAYQVAEIYRLGIGVTPDPKRAMDLYTRAAQGGSAGSMFRLGEMLTKGQGIAADPAAGIGWYQRAADAGSAIAQQRLGLAYIEGIIVPRDVPRGLVLMEKAAQLKNVASMSYLAQAYASSAVVERDVGRSQRWAVRAVAAGATDASSSIIAAQALASGALGRPDFDHAQRILRAAIGRGSVSAQLQLGGLLLSLGGPRNEREGIALFQSAAARGHSSALAALGALYAAGNGVAIDPARSRLYYTVAADMGEPGGYRGLGLAYATGFGVRRDMARAVRLYSVAATKGDVRAMMLLANCQLDGCLGARDPAAAAGNIRAAAALGDNDANYQYALLILGGQAPGGRGEIARHLLTAARNGYPPARAKLKELGMVDPRTERQLATLRETDDMGGVPGA